MTPEQRAVYNRDHYLRNRAHRIADARAYYAEHRDAIRERVRIARQTDPVTIRAKDHATYLRTRDRKLELQKIWRARTDARLREHGLTRQAYDAFLVKQDQTCAICRGAFARLPYIDHDHQTGAIRGLLCHNCNVALGHFRDDPANLRRAIAYVEAAL